MAVAAPTPLCRGLEPLRLLLNLFQRASKCAHQKRRRAPGTRHGIHPDQTDLRLVSNAPSRALGMLAWSPGLDVRVIGGVRRPEYRLLLS